jgi:repressor LexA
MKQELSTYAVNLRRMRKAAHMSQPRLAAVSGVSLSAIRDVESGARGGMRLENIQAIAAALNRTVEELTTEATNLTVPLVGCVGAGGKVQPVDDCDHAETEHVAEAPPNYRGEKMAAVKVMGDSMHPRYMHGEILYYRPTDRVDETACIGRECVCKVLSDGDGEVYVKRVHRGSGPGLFTLRSYNFSDIEDVRLAWASPVLWVKQGNGRG